MKSFNIETVQSKFVLAPDHISSLLYWIMRKRITMDAYVQTALKKLILRIFPLGSTPNT